MREVTAYHCDYCKKVNLTKGSMKNHERDCWNNEGNKHKCFDSCENLTRKLIESESRYSIYTCSATGQQMFSYKIQHKKHINKEGLVRMPLECDKYKFNPDTPF